MNLQYKEFSRECIASKITNIEDFFELINPSEKSEKEMRLFFRDIIENESDNYLRKISLETLCVLCCFEKVRVSSLVDIMLDIDNEDDPFLLIITLRYLALFFETDELILQKLEANKYSIHQEVSSEAFYRLGMIKFYQIQGLDEFELLNHLYACKDLFEASMTIENRIDAEFYIGVIEFIEKVLSQDTRKIEQGFEQVTDKLRRFSDGFIKESRVIFEHQIYKAMITLKQISLSLNRIEVWSDFYKEFVKLTEFNYELQGLEVYNNKYYMRYLNSLKENINQNILRPIYLRNLRFHKLRIQNLIHENESNIGLVQYLKDLCTLIDNNKKKR